MKDMLRAFWQKNNQVKPEHILFYRDGVSDGQFQEVSGCIHVSAVPVSSAEF